jgi:hypothetical protein
LSNVGENYIPTELYFLLFLKIGDNEKQKRRKRRKKKNGTLEKKNKGTRMQEGKRQ